MTLSIPTAATMSLTTTGTGEIDMAADTGTVKISGRSINIGNVAGNRIGFFGATAVAQPPTPAANALAIISALQSLGLFA